MQGKSKSMKNTLIKCDDKFVHNVSTPAGRTKMITVLERSRIASFYTSIFIMICTILMEFIGGNISVLTGLCGVIFVIIFISTDSQIKWLKSVNHEQMINRKEKA